MAETEPTLADVIAELRAGQKENNETILELSENLGIVFGATTRAQEAMINELAENIGKTFGVLTKELDKISKDDPRDRLREAEMRRESLFSQVGGTIGKFASAGMAGAGGLLSGGILAGGAKFLGGVAASELAAFLMVGLTKGIILSGGLISFGQLLFKDYIHPAMESAGFSSAFMGAVDSAAIKASIAGALGSVFGVKMGVLLAAGTFLGSTISQAMEKQGWLDREEIKKKTIEVLGVEIKGGLALAVGEALGGVLALKLGSGLLSAVFTSGMVGLKPALATAGAALWPTLGIPGIVIGGLGLLAIAGLVGLDRYFKRKREEMEANIDKEFEKIDSGDVSESFFEQLGFGFNGMEGLRTQLNRFGKNARGPELEIDENLRGSIDAFVTGAMSTLADGPVADNPKTRRMFEVMDSLLRNNERRVNRGASALITPAQAEALEALMAYQDQSFILDPKRSTLDEYRSLREVGAISDDIFNILRGTPSSYTPPVKEKRDTIVPRDLDERTLRRLSITRDGSHIPDDAKGFFGATAIASNVAEEHGIQPPLDPIQMAKFVGLFGKHPGLSAFMIGLGLKPTGFTDAEVRGAELPDNVNDLYIRAMSQVWDNVDMEGNRVRQAGDLGVSKTNAFETLMLRGLEHEVARTQPPALNVIDNSSRDQSSKHYNDQSVTMLAPPSPTPLKAQ
jgi:hypothetical protein